MFFDVVEARHVENYLVELKFEDGASGVADLSPYMEKGTVLEQLMDKTLFKSFRLEYGTLVWKSGELDIAPETLYAAATGREVQYRQPTGLAF